jgi:peptidoglycan hydrolase CwlO-like protein
MKDAAKMADNIANSIETTSSYLRVNWKSIVIVLWMMLVTFTLIGISARLHELSSHNQVANLRMSVEDVQYSVSEMETEIEKLDRSVSKIEKSVSDMQSTVNRIHTEVRNNR